MFFPFLSASFGSLLGCWTSFKLSQSCNWLSFDNAVAATACLSASYVGGSANYFATGRIINASPDLLGSLATADLLVMAIYFLLLSVSLDWKWLRSRFYVPEKDTKNVLLNSGSDDVGKTRRPQRLSNGSTACTRVPYVSAGHAANRARTDENDASTRRCSMRAR